MSINATSSSTTSVNNATQVNSASNSDSAKKSSTDTSFKDEMNKVSTTEVKEEKTVDNNMNKGTEQQQKQPQNEAIVTIDSNNVTAQVLTAQIQATKDFIPGSMSNHSADLSSVEIPGATMGLSEDSTNVNPLSLAAANSMLTDDIAQMAASANFLSSEVQEILPAQQINQTELTETSKVMSSFIKFSDEKSIKMTEADAEFFINLTQDNNVSVQNITLQAQNMVNNGAEVKEVKQNMQISQALLDAINVARENNQPLRIDFDQNISVILRVNKEGAISANFIPGDKAVEQYLRNNIESLKATFNENDLPYTELSYSNRGKQQQKQSRQNKQ